MANANAENCFNNSKLQERGEMLTAFSKKQYDEFDKKFQALCKKYSSNLVCSVDSVEPANADKKMKELTSQGRCTEVMRYDSGGVAKIYFTNDKNAAKK